MDDTWWKKISELDDTQREIISLDIEGNYMVVGPPGSGKTNILLLRASYLKSAGLENCVVITYTRSLREFITSGRKVPGAWVKTFSSWGTHFLSQRGLDLTEFREEMGEPEKRARIVEAVSKEIKKLQNPKRYYDSILIDEVQDYSKEEVALLAELTSRLYVVGDDRQRIYAQDGATSAAVTLGCEVKRLQAHYRMGRKICEVADKLLPDTSSLLASCYYDEKKLPSEVRTHQGNLATQLPKLTDILKLQMKAYPGQWIGVLAAKWTVLEAVIAHLNAAGMSDLYKVQREGENRAFDPEHPICIMTIQSAKGVEFRGVHLIGADIFPYYTREKAFTAVTRAKTTLDVYHDGDMDSSLRTALATRRIPIIDLDE